MSFFRSRPQGTVFSQLGIVPNQSTPGASQEQVNALHSEVVNLRQQLAEQIEANKLLMQQVEDLSLGRDLSMRLAALRDFLSLGVEQDQSAKISSNELSIEFMTWALGERGLLISDDETKSLMRKLFNIPKEQFSKFPYRGHDDYFYKGFKWKTINNSPNNVQINAEQTVMLPTVSPPQSPRNTGALSPAPVMTRQ